jgi:hypothetical protein
MEGETMRDLNGRVERIAAALEAQGEPDVAPVAAELRASVAMMGRDDDADEAIGMMRLFGALYFTAMLGDPSTRGDRMASVSLSMDLLTTEWRVRHCTTGLRSVRSTQIGSGATAFAALLDAAERVVS